MDLREDRAVNPMAFPWRKPLSAERAFFIVRNGLLDTDRDDQAKGLERHLRVWVILLEVHLRLRRRVEFFR